MPPKLVMAHTLSCAAPPAPAASFSAAGANPILPRGDFLRGKALRCEKALARLRPVTVTVTSLAASLAGSQEELEQQNPSPARGPQDATSAPGPLLALACPICHKPLISPGSASYSLTVASQRKFRCTSCRKSFASSEGWVDAVISSGAKEYLEPDLGWGGSSIFRNPLVSLAYERGWRQNFAFWGFPGPEEEWAMASDALRPAEGEAVVDLSCGSGLFTRRMAQSGLYPLVLALDFSESMLRQTREFIQSDASLDQDGIALVRADVARLPFQTGSVAGIHAGAALHCWPSPHLAVAEISRVLKPGGVFVATTFLNPSLPLPMADDLVKPFRKALVSSSRVYKFWEPEELEELCSLAGLTDYRFERRGGFKFLTATRAKDLE